MVKIFFQDFMRRDVGHGPGTGWKWLNVRLIGKDRYRYTKVESTRRIVFLTVPRSWLAKGSSVRHV